MTLKQSLWDRDPVPGESLFLKSTGSYSSPHCHALYLGEDDTGNKVLLPTYVGGYSIVNLDSIDKEAYRASGRFNIRAEELENGVPVLYDYVFFDSQGKNVHERNIRVQKIDGRWKITERPDDPTWSN